MRNECLPFLEDGKLDITLRDATTMHLNSDRPAEAIMPGLECHRSLSQKQA